MAALDLPPKKKKKDSPPKITNVKTMLQCSQNKEKRHFR